MTPDSILAEDILKAYTPEKVDDEIAILDRVIAKHEEEEERHRTQRADAERLRELLRGVRAYLDSGDPEPEPEKPKRVVRSKRLAIRKIMKDFRAKHPDDDQWWTASEMAAALGEREIAATTNLVRVTMKRMVDSGQLVMSEDGKRFALPE